MKPIELKPCRLCGNAARRVESPAGAFRVECSNAKCGMRTQDFKRGAEAVKRWNAANTPPKKRPPRKRPEGQHHGGRR